LPVLKKDRFPLVWVLTLAGPKQLEALSLMPWASRTAGGD
jgi:hypothetical protein